MITESQVRPTVEQMATTATIITSPTTTTPTTTTSTPLNGSDSGDATPDPG